jgi:hypothetical protein
MTIGQLSAPPSGDSEATKAAATDGVQAPPSPRSPLPESWVCRGSRFWALAGESSDEEEEAAQDPAAQLDVPPPDLGHRRSRSATSCLQRGVRSLPELLRHGGRGGAVGLRQVAGAHALVECRRCCSAADLDPGSDVLAQRRRGWDLRR